MAAEAKVYTFSIEEVVEALVKKEQIHEGIWGIYIEFGFGVANVPTSAEATSFRPAVINSVNKMGIQRFDSPIGNLTVDASKVNPEAPQPVEPQTLLEKHL
jgi:hypothetical protein